MGLGKLWPACALDALPDEVLETIFVAAVLSERQLPPSDSPGCAAAHASKPSPAATALPRVCRRWHDVYHSSPALHGTLALNLRQLEQLGGADGGAALCRMLALRGRAARRLWAYSEGAQLRMAALLQLVSPQLQSAYLGPGAPAAAAVQLTRFRQLRRLDLPAGAAAEAGPGLLPALAQLEELTLREGLPPGMLSSLRRLPRLRLLSLTLTGALPADAHRQLAGLTALEELHIYLQPAQPTRFELQPAALAGLTRLRSLLLVAPGCANEALLALGPGLPCLGALQELQVEGRVGALPADLWQCAALTRLDLDLRASAHLPSAPPLPAPCLPALEELRLSRCRLRGGALPPAVCRLGGLRRLEVSRCGLAGGCAHSALPPGFERLTRLEHVSLEGNTLCTLPPAVAALPALRHLDLSCNALAWLPPGPYLARLATLILSANRLAAVPPELAGAPALEVLDLSGNVALELSTHDVHATLATMPRLALLCCGKGATCGLGVPLPPVPAAAAGLEWRTPSVAALVALGRALPHLQIDLERTALEYEGV